MHLPAIGALCAQAAALDLKNLRIVREDVLRLLNEQLAPAAFDQVCVFFPDPFPKRPERRLIRPLFTELVALHVGVRRAGLGPRPPLHPPSTW